MKSGVNIKKRYVYFAIGLLILIAGIYFVAGVDKTKAWHPWEQIDFSGVGDCDNICTDASGDSDWIISGSNIYRSSGNVGIGTASPTENLEVYDGSGNVKLLVKSSAGQAILYLDALGGYNPAIMFMTGGHTRASTYWHETVNAYKISVNGQDRMVIDSNGSVGIGTTYPRSKLEVAGDIKVSGKVTADSFYGSFSNDISCDWVGWTNVGGMSCGGGGVCVEFIYAPEVYCSGGIVTQMRTASACVSCESLI